MYSDGLAEGSFLRISPLKIRKEPDLPIYPSVLQDYSDWKNATTPMAMSGAPPILPNSTTEETRVVMDQGLSEIMKVRLGYSPLTPFFSTKDMPASKLTKKTMIGDNGWLERTKAAATPEKKTLPAKKGGLLNSLKKMAREMVDHGETKGSRRPRESEKQKDRAGGGLTISLDPREQSLVYCELEFLLTSALNDYITNQFNSGLLDTDKLKKVADRWQQKGRPKVIGFRYDLETQLELVRLHATQFRFHGRQAVGPAALSGNLEMMKVNARAIRVRTFCQPDTVMAKQLLDAQGLLCLLGCSEGKQIQLAEIVQFFKTVLERERSLQTQCRARGSSASADGRKEDCGSFRGQKSRLYHGRGLESSLDPDENEPVLFGTSSL